MTASFCDFSCLFVAHALAEPRLVRMTRPTSASRPSRLRVRQSRSVRRPTLHLYRSLNSQPSTLTYFPYEISNRLYTLLFPRGTVPNHVTPAPPKSFGVIVASRLSTWSSTSFVACTLSLLPVALSVKCELGLKTPLSTDLSSSGEPTPSTMRKN